MIDQHTIAGRGCSIFVGLVFLTIGLGLLWLLSVVRPAQTDDWVKTPCLIVQSEMDSDGETPVIHYSYTFDDNEYAGKRISLSSNTSKKGEALLQEYPVEGEHFCFVNAARPSEAVLIRGVENGPGVWVVVFISALFAACGLYVAISRGIWMAKRQRPIKRGSVTLRPTAQRLGRFLKAAVFCMIWNLVVSGLAVLLYASPFLLVVILFGAVGLVLIVQAFREFSKIFAPQVLITLRDGLEWRCGETIELFWEIQSASKINEMQLNLICKEITTRYSGSSKSIRSQIDEKIVQAIPITAQNKSGFTNSCRFTVPHGLRVSSEGPDKRIEWAIQAMTTGARTATDDSYRIHLVEG